MISTVATSTMTNHTTFPFTVIQSEEDQPETDGPCETPIPDVFDSSTCVYHVQFQPPLPTSQIELEPLKKMEPKDQVVTFLLNIQKIYL